MHGAMTTRARTLKYQKAMTSCLVRLKGISNIPIAYMTTFDSCGWKESEQSSRSGQSLR
jgi:hypothetical protein